MTLTLTDTASSVVKAISAQSTEAESAGLRISAAEGAADFDLSIAPAAEPADTVIENDGARVFLDENAARALAASVLDAKVDDDGSVQFAVGTQAAATEQAAQETPAPPE